MKYVSVNLLIILISIQLSAYSIENLNTSADASGYDIKVKIKGLKDKVCYLGNYYGDKQYIKDTVRTDSKGNCILAIKKRIYI